jgi:cysteine-rich repeat protein
MAASTRSAEERVSPERRRNGWWCLAGIPAALWWVGAGCGARTSLDAPEVEPPPPAPQCGNTLVEEGEGCDDGNTLEEDGCLAGCVEARCGDGVVATFEACEPAASGPSVNCREDCTIPSCGDGLVDPGEECDEGGVDTATCSALCRVPRCGDGIVQPATEQCDAGAGNVDRFALASIVEGVVTPLGPVPLGGASIEAFYGYDSASAHTGYEAAFTSSLFVVADGAGSAWLVSVQGVDGNLDPPERQPSTKVQQRFEGLPGTCEIVIADDKPEEFFLESANVVVGDWKFDDNVDGGVIGGLPLPGAWSVEITSTFDDAIDAWQLVDGAGADATRALDPESPVWIVAQLEPSPCRTDCTVPRCGDGLLDPGERCDDGNTSGGDGCRADCSATE